MIRFRLYKTETLGFYSELKLDHILHGLFFKLHLCHTVTGRQRSSVCSKALSKYLMGQNICSQGHWTKMLLTTTAKNLPKWGEKSFPAHVTSKQKKKKMFTHDAVMICSTDIDLCSDIYLMCIFTVTLLHRTHCCLTQRF